MSTNLPNPADSAAASNTGLTLIPPQPVPVVTETDAGAMVKLDQATAARIDAMVSGYVKALAATDPHSQDFSSKVDSIHAMGNDEIRQSANVSNRLLDKPVKAMESGPFSKGATVSKSLVDLRHTVEDLDPSRQGLMNPKHLFGLIPFGSRLRDYFGRYQSAQGHLNAIINALYRGQDELRKDNAAIEQEKVNIWDIKGKLEQYIYLAGKLDSALEAEIDTIGQTDPERAKALREDVLFLCTAEAAGPAHPAGSQRPGLPGARAGAQEQPGTDQGRRPRDHDDGVGAADGGDRRPGADQPEDWY